MKKIAIIKNLKKSIIFLFDNPILLLLGLTSSLSTILLINLFDRNLLARLFFLLIDIFIVCLVIRFTYDRTKAQIAFKDVFNPVASRYLNIIAARSGVFLLFLPLMVVVNFIVNKSFDSPVVYLIFIIFFSLIFFVFLLLLLKVIFFQQLILLDNEKITSSFKKSWLLTNGNLLRLLAVVISTFLPVILYHIVGLKLTNFFGVGIFLVVHSISLLWRNISFTFCYIDLKEKTV